MMWLLVLEQSACSTSGLSPDDWYPVSAPAEAAAHEAADAIAVCSDRSASRDADRAAS